MSSPTEEQLAIIKAPLDRHIKVLAGPGTGKSYVCSHRVQYLIENGIEPESILVTMFNTEPITEFKEKMAELDCELPIIKNYHMIAQKLIKALVQHGEMDEAELVTDELKLINNVSSAISSAIEETGYSEAKEDNGIPVYEMKVQQFFEQCKNQLVEPSLVFDKHGHEELHKDVYLSAFEIFEANRKANKQRYFSDLIKDLVETLDTSPRALEIVTGHIKYLIIDEYQDINPPSQRMMEYLSLNAMVMLVGDDDQTINEWRGSQPKYLIEYCEDVWKNPLVFFLSLTFRFGHQVSLLANSSIQHNVERVDKLCRSTALSGRTTDIHILFEDKTNNDKYLSIFSPVQNAFARAVKFHYQKYRRLSNCYVLVRLKKQSMFIEGACLLRGIPVNIAGKSILDVRELNILLAVIGIKQAKEPGGMFGDVIALLQYPTVFLRKKAIENLTWMILTKDVDGVVHFLSDKKGRHKESISRRVDAIIGLIDSEKEFADAYKDYISSSMADSDLFDKANTDLQRYSSYAVVQWTVKVAEKLKDPEKISTWIYEQRKSAYIKSEDAINVITVNSSKGLSIDTVIVPGLMQGIFPATNENGGVDEESERKLFFVATTRVKNDLFLLTPPDEDYKQNLYRCTGFKPLGTKVFAERASQFLYESNAKGSSIVGKALDFDSKRVKLPSYTEISLFNEYLSSVESHLRIEVVEKVSDI